MEILANKWQRTGNLRGLIREIHDLTEKRDGRSRIGGENRVNAERPGAEVGIMTEIETIY